jgi:hypothetical protein
MPERITMDRLRNLVAILNRETKNQYDYSLYSAYGGLRLVRKQESIDVSPRLGKGELYEWIHAYRQGIDIGRDLGRS